MFERAPSPYPEHTEAAAIKRAQRKAEKRAKLPAKFLIGTVALTSLNYAYWTDVHEQKAIVEESAVSINDVIPKGDAGQEIDPFEPTTTTVFADGFNAYDANYLARVLAPAVREINPQGPLLSIGYNNAILNREEIAETLLTKLDDEKPDNLSFFGYSQGGITNLEAAADVITKTDATVETIIFASTPYGFDGLREEQKEKIGLGKAFLSIPGAEYSSAIRFASAFMGSTDTLIHGEEKFTILALGRAVNHAREQILPESKTTSNSLLLQQLFKIDDAQFEKEFETIAAAGPARQLPLVVYLKSGAGARDTVVDDDFSSNKLCTAATKAGLRCLILEVPDIKHGAYYETPDQYATTLQENQEIITSLVALNRSDHEAYIAEAEETLELHPG